MMTKIKKGNTYYFAKDKQPFTCIEATDHADDQSKFVNAKGAIHQFYNHDIFDMPYE